MNVGSRSILLTGNLYYRIHYSSRLGIESVGELGATSSLKSNGKFVGHIVTGIHFHIDSAVHWSPM